MQPRLVFMGSPEFALPSLQALAASFQVVGVVTQPDRPAGRGRKVKSPPIKELAIQLGLPLIQPRRLSEPEAMEKLHDWAPDLIVVAAFGQILKPAVLDLPRSGSLNVHASLLPRWRGAAPIHAAILHGDTETGITIMKMDPGLDTGPILSQRGLPIHPDDTAGSLSPRLAHLGADLLVETLPPFLDGELVPQPQDDSQATYAPTIKKEEGALDFTQPASDLARRVRAFSPWPGTYFIWKNQPLKIHQAHPADDAPDGEQRMPGERTRHMSFPAIRALDALLVLDIVQPAGKKPMAGDVFLRGAKDW